VYGDDETWRADQKKKSGRLREDFNKFSNRFLSIKVAGQARMAQAIRKGHGLGV
jgi:hypothetical protein